MNKHLRPRDIAHVYSNFALLPQGAKIDKNLKEIKQGIAKFGDDTELVLKAMRGDMKAKCDGAVFVDIARMSISSVDERLVDSIIERHIGAAQREKDLAGVQEVVEEARAFREGMKEALETLPEPPTHTERLAAQRQQAASTEHSR